MDHFSINILLLLFNYQKDNGVNRQVILELTQMRTSFVKKTGIKIYLKVAMQTMLTAQLVIQ